MTHGKVTLQFKGTYLTIDLNVTGDKSLFDILLTHDVERITIEQYDAPVIVATKTQRI